ncbi:MAG: LPS export ABC transporter periplasmic protein LptC [Acidobacteriaceae bacterium]|nr:LPS export ABC transporter periplasmic protein LptC [Acidobacteriaceae bacterium]
MSVLLLVAAALLTFVVAYTLKSRVSNGKGRFTASAAEIQTRYEALAHSGWKYGKDDPQTNKPIVRVTAASFEATKDPSVSELRDVALRLYNKAADQYTYVRSAAALFDEKSHTMRSSGPVLIVMNVPAEKDAEKPADIAGRVQVQTSGVTYNTQSGKADSDQPASFKFSQGDGSATGVSYDPNTKELHLKCAVALDWIGRGPVANKMHIESGELLYRENEQKVYLSPWSKMQRQTTAIQAANSVVTLQDGYLHQIDSDHAAGTDIREDKTTGYSADKMTALFDDNGALISILGEGNAKVISTSPSSRTTLTGNRADLKFDVQTKENNGILENESDLRLVTAAGHAVAQSDPLPQPGVQMPESRTLRSETIVLQMRPGGKEVQTIDAPGAAELEFKPNRPDQSHRTLTSSRLQILYGDGSYIDRLLAWNVATQTERPPSQGSPDTTAPSHTWSDQMIATFVPNSNNVATIDQTGHFRYQQGGRKASSEKALFDQGANRMTLLGHARMSDENGTALADTIVMNQSTGDMDATGHVASTHAPDKNQKPGTSVLDDTKVMEARADSMESRGNNTQFTYTGHAVIWQGGNRISANRIDIDRDAQTLHAVGDVVSELVDNKAQNTGSAPIFTAVYAPELSYSDDTRVANYAGPVKLVRNKMTVTSKQLEAFLNAQGDKADSSLDHAFADGNVAIVDIVAPGHTRTGSSEHCEYYTKDDKVVLNGGSPQLVDSYRGLSKGRQLTYFSDDDRLIVEGADKNLAFTRMKKK